MRQPAFGAQALNADKLLASLERLSLTHSNPHSKSDQAGVVRRRPGPPSLRRELISPHRRRFLRGQGQRWLLFAPYFTGGEVNAGDLFCLPRALGSEGCRQSRDSLLARNAAHPQITSSTHIHCNKHTHTQKTHCNRH